MSHGRGGRMLDRAGAPAPLGESVGTGGGDASLPLAGNGRISPDLVVDLSATEVHAGERRTSMAALVFPLGVAGSRLRRHRDITLKEGTDNGRECSESQDFMNQRKKKSANTGTPPAEPIPESAFVPAASRHLNFISSGEEDEAPAEFGNPQSRGTPQNFGAPQSHGTPVSSGSKRTASSTRSTATGPGKKPKNAAVRNMNSNMTRFSSSYDRRTEMLARTWQERRMTIEQENNIKHQQLQLQQTREERRREEQKLVLASATELGVHLMENELWNGVVNILNDDNARNVYLCTPVEGRLQMIKRYAAMEIHAQVDGQVHAQVDIEDEDDWWEELWNMAVEDDDEVLRAIYQWYV